MLEIDLERASTLLPRYLTDGPRYTSYPTVPTWREDFGPARFEADLARAGGREEVGLSLYVHVPFCRSLCHFCACNRVITRDPDRPARYLESLELEVERVASVFGDGGRRVTQQHWGGGTPTHLTPEQIHRLARIVARAFPRAADAEVSVEVDPRVTSDAHLRALRECGFNRLSMGVQDFDPRTQRAIHRVQSVEETATLVETARQAGFRSVGSDLIYGLPFQTLESFGRTLDAVVALRPDRIALYSYAHVTWVAKQQRGFERHDLPDAETKLRLFVAALRRLLEAGYVYVGLDHFARPEDDLVKALRSGTLRRNFMGYTTQAGADVLAFGPSAISDLGTSYAQSHRDLAAWEGSVRGGGLATMRGWILSPDDQKRRWTITRILCQGAVQAEDYAATFGEELGARFAPELEHLEAFEADGLVRREADGGFALTPLGRLFARNVAMLFDAYLPEQRRSGQRLFSRTV